MEILSGLSQRIQQRMRELILDYRDIDQLYLAEQPLTRLCAVLQRLELKYLSQFDALRTMMHNSAARLENSDSASDPVSVMLPVKTINSARLPADIPPEIPGEEKNEPLNRIKWVYVTPPEQQPSGEVLAMPPAPAKLWKSFAIGMFTMLVSGSVAVCG